MTAYDPRDQFASVRRDGYSRAPKPGSSRQNPVGDVTAINQVRRYGDQLIELMQSMRQMYEQGTDRALGYATWPRFVEDKFGPASVHVFALLARPLAVEAMRRDGIPLPGPKLTIPEEVEREALVGESEVEFMERLRWHIAQGDRVGKFAEVEVRHVQHLRRDAKAAAEVAEDMRKYEQRLRLQTGLHDLQKIYNPAKARTASAANPELAYAELLERWGKKLGMPLPEVIRRHLKALRSAA